MLGVLNIILGIAVWAACTFLGGLLADYFVGGAGWWTGVGFMGGTTVFAIYTILCVTILADSHPGDL